MRRCAQKLCYYVILGLHLAIDLLILVAKILDLFCAQTKKIAYDRNFALLTAKLFTQSYLASSKNSEFRQKKLI